MAIGSLTCGQYQLYIAKRGGSSLVCRLDGAADISFNRTLNDYSEATINVAMNAHCVSALASVNPWQHELLIYRNGTLAWCGPLVSLKYQPAISRIRVYARDLWAWTYKRFIEPPVNEDYDVEDVDAKEVFEWILRQAYNKQPWNMTWSLSDTGIPITRFYAARFSDERWGGSYLTAGKELQSISTYGIDFTVVNRHMYGGDLIVKPPTTSQLKIADQNWTKAPDIDVNGAQMSTRTAVAGGSGGYYGYYDDQLWIEETPNSPYGLLETLTVKPELDDEYTTDTPNAITQEAVGRHALLSKPSALISGGQLAGDAPYNFNDLIPGVPVSVGLLNSIRQLDSEYRLVGLNVSVSDEGETIDLALTLPGVSDIVGES